MVYHLEDYIVDGLASLSFEGHLEDYIVDGLASLSFEGLHSRRSCQSII